MKMQKIFAVVLAVMLFVLPCACLADVGIIGGADGPTTIFVAAGAEEESQESVAKETGETKTEETDETKSDENGEDKAKESKTKFGFYPDRFVDSLQYMGKGLVGIFVVTGMIILVLFVMDKIGNRKKKDNDQ